MAHGNAAGGSARTGMFGSGRSRDDRAVGADRRGGLAPGIATAAAVFLVRPWRIFWLGFPALQILATLSLQLRSGDCGLALRIVSCGVGAATVLSAVLGLFFARRGDSPS